VRNGQVEIGGDLLEGLPAGPGILDFVVEVEHLFAAAFGLQLAHQIVAHLRQGLPVCRDDSGDAQQRGGQPPLDRLAHLARVERERGLGEGRVRQFAAGQFAQRRIGLRQALLTGDVEELRALGNARARLRRLLGIGERDHLDGPALRRAEFAGAPFVGRFDGLLGDLDARSELDRIGMDQRDLAALGDLEQRRVFLVELPQHAFGGLPDGDVAGVHLEIQRIAALALELPQRLDQRPGRLEAAGQSVRNGAAQHLLALRGDELGFAEAVGRQKPAEVLRIELALGILEVRIAGDPADDRPVGHGEAEIARLGGEGRVADELVEDLPVEPHVARHLRRDRAADLARHLPQLAVEDVAVLVRGDLDVADGDQHVALAGVEHVRHAPHGEACRQQGDEDLRDPAPGAAAHGIKHLALSSILVMCRAPAFNCPKGASAISSLVKWLISPTQRS
jgi:hypothetical protein